MMQWAEKLRRETIVLVEGYVRDAQQEVRGTSFQDGCSKGLSLENDFHSAGY
jgi:hypothetical protein